MSYLDTIRETSIDVVNDPTRDDGQKILITSRETVFDYKRYCREICVNIVLDESQQFIGGPGKIVERFFLLTVPNREKETLLPLIKERIAPGTKIMSDC